MNGPGYSVGDDRTDGRRSSPGGCDHAAMPTVSELRLVVTAPDYDEALHFYRDVLGLPEREAYAFEDGRVTILEAGRATLELTDPPHAAYIDEVEVGRRVAGHVRVAFEVGDTVAATATLADACATVVAQPRSLRGARSTRAWRPRRASSSRCSATFRAPERVGDRSRRAHFAPVVRKGRLTGATTRTRVRRGVRSHGKATGWGTPIRRSAHAPRTEGKGA